MRDQLTHALDRHLTVVVHGHRPEVTSGEATEERQQPLNPIRDDLMAGRMTFKVRGYLAERAKAGSPK
jgi:hypothetical protein